MDFGVGGAGGEDAGGDGVDGWRSWGWRADEADVDAWMRLSGLFEVDVEAVSGVWVDDEDLRENVSMQLLVETTD